MNPTPARNRRTSTGHLAPGRRGTGPGAHALHDPGSGAHWSRHGGHRALFVAPFRSSMGAAMRKKHERADWQPGWERFDDPWDGTSLQDRAPVERAGEKAERAAKRQADLEEWERKRAEAKERRSKRRAKADAKELARNKAAGIFSAVTRVDDEGRRHCRRCDGTDFKSERRKGAIGEAATKGGVSTVVFASLGPAALFAGPLVAAKGVRDATFKVCKTCGAAYPLARPSKSIYGPPT